MQSASDLSKKHLSKLLDEKMALIEMKSEFKERNLNEGFSGGEKKRNEILQMAVLEPKLAILDETDSGLDIDAMRIVAKGVNSLMSPDNSFDTHHPLSTTARLYQSRFRPCCDRWKNRPIRWA